MAWATLWRWWMAPDKHNTRMRRSGRPRRPEAGARTSGSTLAERMTVQDFICTDEPNIDDLAGRMKLADLTGRAFNPSRWMLDSSALYTLDQLLQTALPVLNIFLRVIDNFLDLFISSAELISNVFLQVVELINSFLRESPNISTGLSTGFGCKYQRDKCA